MNHGHRKPYSVPYRTHTGHQSKIGVFRAYPDLVNLSHYRHLAYRLNFKSYGENWFVEITPTYHFTSEGIDTYRYYEERLKGIKRLEGNRAVLSVVELLAYKFSSENPLFGDYRLLRFAERLEEFTLDFGVNDELWGNRGGDKSLEDEEPDLFSA